MALSMRQAGWALLALTVVAVGFTVMMVLQYGHAMQPVHYASAVALVAIMVSWPFVTGWQPWRSEETRFRPCGECGTLWSPREAGAPFCPACGKT